MKTLEPRLVIATGAPCTGKTTVLSEVTRSISNAVYLDRDTINYGILYVPETTSAELLSFREYVARDTVFPEHAHPEETIFGTMLQIDPKNAYHRRHARDQSHLIQSLVAKENICLGKVPIVSCFGIRQLREGVPKRFMEQPVFSAVKKYIVHFAVMNEEVYFERVKKRAEENLEAAVRDSEMLTSREKFNVAFEKRHGKMLPAELGEYRYLLIDTGAADVATCVNRCIEYISYSE